MSAVPSRAWISQRFTPRRVSSGWKICPFLSAGMSGWRWCAPSPTARLASCASTASCSTECEVSAVATVPLIALLTDFGASDGYPGVMKGVILGIAPATPLVDLTHEIAPQDIRAGAWVLQTAWRYFPEGSVF